VQLSWTDRTMCLPKDLTLGPTQVTLQNDYDETLGLIQEHITEYA